jgi:hypothetical protein
MLQDQEPGKEARRQAGPRQRLQRHEMPHATEHAVRRASNGQHRRDHAGKAATRARIGYGAILIECLDSCGYLCAATARWDQALTIWAACAAALQAAGIDAAFQTEQNGVSRPGRH